MTAAQSPGSVDPVPSPPPHGAQPILLLPQALKPGRKSLALCSSHMWEPSQPLAETSTISHVQIEQRSAAFKSSCGSHRPAQNESYFFHFH